MLEVVVKEWECLLDYAKQGKVIAGGAMTGRRGGCGIFQVDSIEELHALIGQMPMYPFADWEIIPLTPTEFTLEAAKRALAAARES